MNRKLIKNKIVAMVLIILGIANVALTNDILLLIIGSIISVGLLVSKDNLIS